MRFRGQLRAPAMKWVVFAVIVIVFSVAAALSVAMVGVVAAVVVHVGGEAMLGARTVRVTASTLEVRDGVLGSLKQYSVPLQDVTVEPGRRCRLHSPRESLFISRRHGDALRRRLGQLQ